MTVDATPVEKLDAGLPPRFTERGQQVQIIDIELP
jgi:hypothetical protein